MADQTPSGELREAAAKVREHPDIFDGAAEEIAALLDADVDTAEQLGVPPSRIALVVARAINGSTPAREITAAKGDFEAYKQRVLADLPPKKFISFND
jgi:hypothetical protein